MMITILCINREKSKTTRGYDSFSEDKLFFRFGYEIDRFTFPIRYSKDIDNNKTKDVIENLKDFVIKKINKDIDSRIENGSHKTEVIRVFDKEKRSDMKSFVKFSYKGKRGSEATHFILFEFIGAYTVIHFTTFVKGIPYWYDQLEFILKSPFKFWFWIIPFLRDDYSIMTKLSRYYNNSFELYDIQTYLQASRYTIIDSIRDYLDKNNLLPKELETMFFNQLVINNYVSGNQMNVSGKNNSVKGIKQKS